MTKWVQVDLGQSRPIDEVILVPAYVVYGGHPGPGFGFPPRFRVEISDEPDFAHATRAGRSHAGRFRQSGRRAGADRRRRQGRPVSASRPRGCGSGRAIGAWPWPSWSSCPTAPTSLAARRSARSIRSKPAPSWAQVNLVDGYSSLEQLQFEGDGVADASAAVGRRNRQARRRADRAARKRCSMATPGGR